MKYFITIFEEEQELSYTAMVDKLDKNYFVNNIIPRLELMTFEKYSNSVAIILNTGAHWSYILFNNDVYWCIEWDPGLIVIRFLSNGEIYATSIRSPIPEFGGRKPLLSDTEKYDEDEPNCQYNLIFNAWDAQFDEEHRTWNNFKPANAKEKKMFELALKMANTKYDQLLKQYTDEKIYDKWHKKCIENITYWGGEGA